MARWATNLQGRAFWKTSLVVQQGQQFLQLPVMLGKALAQEAQRFLDRVVQLEEEQELVPLNGAQWLAIRSCLQVQLQL